MLCAQVVRCSRARRLALERLGDATGQIAGDGGGGAAHRTLYLDCPPPSLTTAPHYLLPLPPAPLHIDSSLGHHSRVINLSQAQPPSASLQAIVPSPFQRAQKLSPSPVPVGPGLIAHSRTPACCAAASLALLLSFSSVPRPASPCPRVPAPSSSLRHQPHERPTPLILPDQSTLDYHRSGSQTEPRFVARRPLSLSGSQLARKAGCDCPKGG